LRQRLFDDFEYTDSQSEVPSWARHWVFDKDLKPELITKQMISYTIHNYRHTSGLHGHYATWGETFLLNPLRRITLKDSIDLIDQEDCLKFLVKFCSGKISDLKRKVSQTEEDLVQSEVNSFELKSDWDTFGSHFFSKNGLEVFFNPYTIGPYSFGQYIVSIPYSELKSALTRPEIIQQIQEAGNC
jgi:hypothetical protein